MLRDVVHSVRRKAGVNIIIDESIDETVTIDLAGRAVAPGTRPGRGEGASCIVVQEAPGGVLKVEKPPRVYFAFENADIQNVIDTIAKISGANIVVAPEVQGTITLRLQATSLGATRWRLPSKTLGYVVVEEERGILRVIPPSSMQRGPTVTKQLPAALRAAEVRPTCRSCSRSTCVNNQPMMQQQQGDADQLRAARGAASARLTPDVGTMELLRGRTTSSS